MYIINYYTEPALKSSCGFNLYKINIFLTNYGKYVWNEEEDVKVIIKDYLEANELYGESTVVNDVLYYKIDCERTKLSDFYNYGDVKGEQCWRPFYTIYGQEPEKEDWSWKYQEKELELGSFGSIHRVWQDYFNSLRED